MIEIAVSDTGSGFGGRRSAKPVSDLFYDQGDRHGRRPLHQPLDYRSPRRPDVGRNQLGGRRDVPFHAACRIKREFDRWRLGERSMSSTTIEAMRDSLDFLLGSAGFNVTLFEFGPAFPRCASRRWTLDAWSPTSACPGIDGIELLRRLKAGGSQVSGASS